MSEWSLGGKSGQFKTSERHRALGKVWREKNRARFDAKNLEWMLRTKYNITVQDYTQIKEKQRDLCAICGQPETFVGKSKKVQPLGVDHCHQTGKVRGLLCRDCNLSIGHMKDSVERLKAAIKYLESNE